MTWDVTVQELRAVIAKDVEQRYQYFVEHVAQEGALWSLYSDGWVLMSSENGRELVPVWPHPRYAGLFAEGNCNGCEIREVSLASWLDNWVPRMEQHDRRVAVFPLWSKSKRDFGVYARPIRVASDLQHAIDDAG